VVETEIDDAAGISADGTASSGLLDQHSLQLLLSAGHRLAYASLTGPPVSPARTAAVLRELNYAVSFTVLELDRSLASRVRRSSAVLNVRYRRLQIRIDAASPPRHGLNARQRDVSNACKSPQKCPLRDSNPDYEIKSLAV
jgi:hypothetical protein